MPDPQAEPPALPQDPATGPGTVTLSTSLLGELQVPGSPEQAATLQALAARAAVYATRARGGDTRWTYRSAWRAFSTWCASHGQPAAGRRPGDGGRCARSVPPRPQPFQLPRGAGRCEKAPKRIPTAARNTNGLPLRSMSTKHAYHRTKQRPVHGEDRRSRKGSRHRTDAGITLSGTEREHHAASARA